MARWVAGPTADRALRQVYDTTPIALISIDAEGRVLRHNDAAARGFPHALAPGRQGLVADLFGAPATDALLAAVLDRGHARRELRVRAAGRDDRDFEVEAVRAGHAIEISLVDVSGHRRDARTLEHLAYHDFLTGSLNRRGLEREIDRLIGERAVGQPLALIYIDLDRFKSINDVFGHAAGDAVVTEVARRLGTTLRPGQPLGRVGGDEFLVALPGCGLAEATALGERMLQGLRDSVFEFEGMQLAIEASMGVIEAAPGMQNRELLAFADEACAQSKRSGRGRITALDPDNSLLANFQAEQRFGSRLRFSPPTGQMRIYAQPIVSLRSANDPLSYEVLLRIADDRGRIDPPARLIAAAERQGAMASIDRFMLEQTLRHLGEHPGFRDATGFVAVNLSGMSLNDERFVEDIFAMLRADPLAAAKTCLEITETVALYDINNTRRFVENIRANGAMVALDDFGAGYTSFAYLKDLPANLLKIDGQFIHGLGRGPRHRSIVRAMQQVGLELGMQCLAEWVEDEATLDQLVGLGIDYAQGYVLARAAPLEAWHQAQVERPSTRRPADRASSAGRITEPATS